jgi:excisionase family DNA binding protein
MQTSLSNPLALAEPLSTRQVAQLLGVTVRTVQLMVDRGELAAWKTPGGHRRITPASVQAWMSSTSPRALAQRRAHAAQKPR